MLCFQDPYNPNIAPPNRKAIDMTTIDITAIGVICGQLQTPFSQLRRIIAELGIEPSARINGIPHYSAADVEKIAAHLRGEVHAH